MASMHPEYQPDNFFAGPLDFPFWQQDESCFNNYVEPYVPEYTYPYHDNSSQSSFSSFNGSMVWMESSEQLPSPNNPVTPPTPTVPTPIQATLSNTNLKVMDTQHKDNIITNRKRKQQSAASINSKSRRSCRSQSSSSSLKSEYSSHGIDPNIKEEVNLERSRKAANKFRERQRNEIAQLASEEHTIEDSNRQLRSMLNALTSEILALKMQILQHTNCNCKLIQAYINKEAHHFVQSLEGVANA
ncbi:transcription factor atf21 [Pochonia chlamydosporia 170]|uniref:Transcription factor atf21 n=1 Tax=Pochonia chlamydosporia 170 TaxID=1380566 RepID=A0A179F3F7_METCM|nr:transcription factor atf21 [Pochonia chlamydosporia 170]OAQ59952.1 transcription factor atf21 [Pochonia chlamydosporia 170]